jgi:hypothetical protein
VQNKKKLAEAIYNGVFNFCVAITLLPKELCNADIICNHPVFWASPDSKFNSRTSHPSGQARITH